MSSNKYPVNFESFFNELLKELSKKSIIYTKTYHKENIIKIKNMKIFVSTNKSSPFFEEIPLKFIRTSYFELLKNKELTQSYLSKKLYVKRSAFIFSAFTLLSYIAYDKNKNSIKIIS